MRRIDSFTWQGKDIAAWFVTIARNLIADHVKSARFRFEVATADMRDADERVDAPDTEVLTRLRDERLVSAIKDLGPTRPSASPCASSRGSASPTRRRSSASPRAPSSSCSCGPTGPCARTLEGVEL